MTSHGKMTLEPKGNNEIVVSRRFDAPRQAVYDAHVRPEVVKRWLTGPDGWSLPVCDLDVHEGGSIRYVWKGTDGKEMGMGGTFTEIDAPPALGTRNCGTRIGPAAKAW